MFARSIKNVASMHGLVVVQKDHVSLRHFHVSGILERDFIHELELVIGYLTIVSKEHVGLVDLTGAIFKAFRSVAERQHTRTRGTRLLEGIANYHLDVRNTEWIDTYMDSRSLRSLEECE